MEGSSSLTVSSSNLSHLYGSCSSFLTISQEKLEAIGRIALAAIAGLAYLISLTCWAEAKEMAISQFQQGCNILFPIEIARSLVPIEKHINPINHDSTNSPEAIALKLEKELSCAQSQMKNEKDKAFNIAQTERNRAALGSIDYHREGDVSLGVCSTIGRRSEMEDQHLATTFSCQLNNREKHDAKLFGVFDGHGGDEAAVFVKKHLKEQLHFYLQQYNPDGLTDVGIWNALKMTFVTLSEAFPEKKSGTTATVALILGDKLWVANVGDSRTVLCNGVTPIQLSEDSKPNNKRLLKGIEMRGGKPMYYRGQWTVSLFINIPRAIGDHNLAMDEGGPGILNPRPKITAYPLFSIAPNSRLVLACDGLWDVASTRQVVEAVNSDLPAIEMAHNITAAALAAGSGDNITTMVVHLP